MSSNINLPSKTVRMELFPLSTAMLSMGKVHRWEVVSPATDSTTNDSTYPPTMHTTTCYHTTRPRQ